MLTFRKEIDRIDAEIQRLFEARMRVSHAIGAYKASHGMPVFDAAREAEKLDALRRTASSEELAEGIVRLYEKLMEISRDAQKRPDRSGADQEMEAGYADVKKEATGHGSHDICSN